MLSHIGGGHAQSVEQRLNTSCFIKRSILVARQEKFELTNLKGHIK